MAVNWYAIHTYSGFENKVKSAIEQKAASDGLSGKIDKIIIPMEAIIEIKDGRKHTVEKKLLPGYILIRMEYDANLTSLIENIQGVSAFVGAKGQPTTLTDEEVKNILEQSYEKGEKPRQKIKYKAGDQVKVTEGPFANFIGSVESIDEEKGKLTVMVSIFGRLTPVELDVLQIGSVS